MIRDIQEAAARLDHERPLEGASCEPYVPSARQDAVPRFEVQVDGRRTRIERETQGKRWIRLERGEVSVLPRGILQRGGRNGV